jgi:protein arginine kinase activator
MTCDLCGKNPATVHLTEIIDEQMSELHLCEECARKKSASMDQQFGLSDLLAGMAQVEKPALKEEESAVAKCPNCGMTYADFKKIGRLGCGECYNVFKRYLAPLLKRIHGSVQHAGKAPIKSARPAKKKSDIQELRARLQKAIDAEDFEEAARLRDQIRILETKKE